MIYNFYFTVISFLLFSNVYSQNIENKNGVVVSYICEVNIDFDKTKDLIPKSILNTVKQEIKDGIRLDYLLKTNIDKSSFELIKKVDNSQNNSNIIANQIYQNEQFPTFKDRTENVYYKVFDIGKKFLVKEPLANHKWVLTKQKAIILGQEVTLAKGSMLDSIKVEAWYAPSIPIKDGPNILTGLPGLILKAEFEINGFKSAYTAQNIEFFSEEIQITLPKAEIVSNAQFMKIVDDLQKKMN